MSNQDKTRYDVMIPFFGKKNDQRVRLYLAALEEEWKRTDVIAFTDNASGKGSNEFNIAEELKIKYFTVPSNNSNNGDEIHDEWYQFKSDLIHRLATKEELDFPLTNSNPNISTSDDILKIIRTQGGNGNKFFQAIIKAHLAYILDNKLDDITTLPFQWSNANKFKFKNSFDNIMPFQFYTTRETINRFPESNNIYFNFKTSKYLLHKRLEDAASQLYKPSNFWSTEEPVLDIYFRVKNDPTKIFTTDANGNKVDVSSGSAKWRELENDKCNGTKVIENERLTCTDYLQNCINTGKQEDIVKCKTYLMNPNFWTDVQKEVDEMLPDSIVSTLTTFGFKFDSKNKKYRSYESVGSWLQSLEAKIKLKQLTIDEYNSISSNTKLTQYLNMLVIKVNQNPAILNSNYFNSNHFDSNDYSQRFNDWSITKYGLTPRILFKKDQNPNISINRQLAFISNNILTLRNLSQNRIMFIPGSGLVANGVAINPVTPFFMTGGNNKDDKDDKNNDINLFSMIGGAVEELEGLRKNSPILKLLVEQSFNQLRSVGKVIDQQTINEVNNIVNSFESNENKLHKALTYINKYIELYDVYKQYDNDNILSIDHIKSFVDAREKYFNKTLKSLDGLDILKELADQVLEKLN